MPAPRNRPTTTMSVAATDITTIIITTTIIIDQSLFPYRHGWARPGHPRNLRWDPRGQARGWRIEGGEGLVRHLHHRRLERRADTEDRPRQHLDLSPGTRWRDRCQPADPTRGAPAARRDAEGRNGSRRAGGGRVRFSVWLSGR